MLFTLFNFRTGVMEHREARTTPSRLPNASSGATSALGDASRKNDSSAINDRDATKPVVPIGERGGERRFCPACVHPSVLLDHGRTGRLAHEILRTHLRAPDSRDARRVLVGCLRSR